VSGILNAGRIRDRVLALTGWRRRGAAFAAGAVSVLALAPFFVWPVLFVTLPVLVWLIDGSIAPEAPAAAKSRRWRSSPLARAAGAGWWFGFGYFFFGLFWIGEAFLVEADKFAWALPFAVTLMPAGLSLFYAAASGVASLAWRPGIGRVVVLALTLGIAEWLRGHVLTGFPWNVLGYALTYPLPLMQSAALVGIYGLTVWAVVIFAGPLVLAAGTAPGSTRPHWRRPLALAALPLLAMTAIGTIQLSRPLPPDVPGVRLRIVQPSVPQREKWVPQNQRAVFDQHLALSRGDPAATGNGLAGITHVVWPEAAMPFLPLERNEALSAISGLLAQDGAHLITGALRRAPKPGVAPPSDPQQPLPFEAMDYFNSLLVFAPAAPAAIYDKIHLVPFGEYLPLKQVLEVTGLGGLARMRGGFTPGPKPRPLLAAGSLQGIEPLICYEALFPGAIVQGAERPRLMLNITNDGWFGNTTGPRQHFHQARVRAVEEGVPLIRAANNGISAVVDADGRVLASLGMNEKGVLDANLPGTRPLPPYAAAGDWLFIGNLLIFGLLALYLARGSSAGPN
jgi:apolipoprotein N-acyltransferase